MFTYTKYSIKTFVVLLHFNKLCLSLPQDNLRSGILKQALIPPACIVFAEDNPYGGTACKCLFLAGRHCLRIGKLRFE